MILKGKLLSTLLAAALLCSCSDETKLTTTSQEALKYYNQGIGYFEKFYYAQAKEALEHAVQADSNFAMAYAHSCA
jgi:Tfp pilus assembly protein PilF